MEWILKLLERLKITNKDKESREDFKAIVIGYRRWAHDLQKQLETVQERLSDEERKGKDYEKILSENEELIKLIARLMEENRSFGTQLRFWEKLKNGKK